MGKSAKLKQARHAPALPTGLAFHTGMQWPHPQPVLLHFRFRGQDVLRTHWSVEDARNIANGLLKYCELVERKQREEQKPTPSLDA